MQVSRYVRPYVTHSQNSVTGEVKFRLEALAAIQRDLFLRTVSSMQRSVFQGWLHLAQGSSVRKHWNKKKSVLSFLCRWFLWKHCSSWVGRQQHASNKCGRQKLPRRTSSVVTGDWWPETPFGGAREEDHLHATLIRVFGTLDRLTLTWYTLGKICLHQRKCETHVFGLDIEQQRRNHTGWLSVSKVQTFLYKLTVVYTVCYVVGRKLWLPFYHLFIWLIQPWVFPTLTFQRASTKREPRIRSHTALMEILKQP